jgi:hypothetical protein
MANTDVTKMSFFAVTDPKLITVDFAQLGKTQQERRARLEKLNTPKPEGTAKELQRLRGELFKLSEDVKNTEINCDNQAGNVKLFEQRITDAINQKKIFVASGNALAERFCEHQIKTLEVELADAQERLKRAEQYSAGSALALKAFDGHERIAELRLILDTPLPEAKK